MDSHARSPQQRGGAAARAGREPAEDARTRLLGGGTEGNERLTVLTGAVLIVLLAVLGVTIVRIGQLIWLHLFLGLVLIGPVALKLASTGYRFVRYYTANPPYRRKGPPAPALRMLGPVLVGLTVIVLATGVALLVVGSRSSSRDTLVLVHKVSFIVWIVVTAIHVLGHLPELVRFNQISRRTRTEIGALRAQIPGFGSAADPPLTEPIPGAGGRWVAIVAAMVFGLALAGAFIPQYGTWTAAASLHHHHDHH
ncbi:MAG TPA: hypothetical protein VE571_12995 [Solirubrobacteraceae bacterium]|nr:hypothetical protein [Solirubrobacteraceae bacterium]